MSMTHLKAVEYVATLLAEQGFVLGSDRFWRNADGRRLPKSSVLRRIAADNTALTETNFLRAFESWCEDDMLRRESELQARLAHKQNTLFNFQPLLSAVLKPGWDELDEAVFKTVIWNIKRGLWDLKQDYEIMPIFMSHKQGGGKSTFCEKVFIEPLAPFSRQLQTLAELNDNFAVRSILGENAVVCVDELAKGGDRTEVSALKKILTQKTVETRRMMSEATDLVPKRAVIIGGANVSISDVIVDATGMRRFWEFKCLDKLDWDFINQFNSLPMWQSIDEHGPAPILPFLDRVTERQDRELRRPSGAENFIREVLEFDEEARTPFKELMQEFNSYCATFNYQRASRHTLKSELDRLLIPCVNLSRSMHYKVKFKAPAAPSK
jgi:hypothetical protein